ncbi:MAG: PKD domain protein [Methanoregula sp. PtaU1.Bin051]|nr:MAG: PKD domain protein [Methanoregula sp. PtaU1.Bin051]
MNKIWIGVVVLAFLLSGIPPVTAATTLNVGEGQTYTTIQAAIDAAVAGDTINVAPGWYNERITINKAITLNGATAGISKKGFPVPGNYVYDNTTQSIIAPNLTQNSPVVAIEKSDVTFDGFIVAMTDAGSYPQYAPTELIRMTAGGNLNNVKIQNNVIGPNTNLTNQNGNAGRMGITVSKWSPGTGENKVYNLQIRNNKIFDAKGDGCGILMIGAKNTSALSLQNQFKGAVIDNNEITGNHRSGIDFSGGVQGGPDAADHIRITNNIISNNGWNSTVDKDDIKWGNGIVLIRMTDQVNDMLPWASRYIDIENNEFTGNEKNGIYIGPITRDVKITGNIIQNNGLGTGGYSKWDGISIDLPETYQHYPLSSLKIYDYLNNIVINENTISGNGAYGIRVNRTPLNGPIDARLNWWGASSGPLNIISNPSGSGNIVSDYVEFAPWYTSASKTTTQGLATGSGATHTVSQENFTTIQKAINTAWPGDIIRVFPGIYDERVIINKPITLLGATTGISKKGYSIPDEYAYDATRESIIQPSSGDVNQEVVNITASNVVLDGFIIAHTAQITHTGVPYPLTNLIGLSNQSNNYTNVRIQNNVIGPNTNAKNPGSQDGSKGRMGIALYGPSSNLAQNLTIAWNKIFDAKGDGCGILLLGSVNSSGTGLIGKYKGSVIDSNEITGNHRSGIELAGGVQGGPAAADHFRITNNTINNNGWYSPSEKTNLKYGNGIVLIHVGSDKENPYSWGSEYVDIDNNEIMGNEKNGIYIGPINRNISITNNTIRNNGLGTGGFNIWDSVQVDLDENYHNPVLKNYAFLANIVLKNNEINASGNYSVKVVKTPTKGAIDARNNWWGTASGPNSAKNPTGTARPVSDNVAFSPWFTNPLKTATRTFPGPVVVFTWDPFEGQIGDLFSFDASASVQKSNTSIQSFQWNFGDGNTSSASASALTTHTYVASKVYTVVLTATDFNGISNQTKHDISVIAKKEAIPVMFNGTTVTQTDGNQKIAFNTTAFTSGNGTLTNTTTEIILDKPKNGWANMTIKGNVTTNAAGDLVVENITEVVLKAAPVITQLSQTAGGVGNVTTSIELSLNKFVEAPLEVKIVEGVNSTVNNAFQLVAGTGMNVNAVAYSMEIKGSALVNGNLSASDEPVVLNMSVSEEWVLANGGLDAIRVMRYSDGGTMVEPLETIYLFTEGNPRMCYFKVISPHGCSIFGVISVAAAPSGGTTGGYQGAQYGGVGGTSGGVSTNTFTGKSSQSESASQQQQGGEMKAPPEEVQGPAPPFAPPPDQEEAIIPLSEGQSLSGTMDQIADYILSHIVTVAALLVLTVACTETLIWYRRIGRL